MVRSEPERSILALPKGRTKSEDCASGERGKVWPYRSLKESLWISLNGPCICRIWRVAYSFSRTTVGFGSRIAAFSRPLASSALHGQATLRPGMLPYQLE